MKPQKDKTYYIDFHDGPDYTHYHDNAKCVGDKPEDIDGPCYPFSTAEDTEDDPLYFPEEAVIMEIKIE